MCLSLLGSCRIGDGGTESKCETSKFENAEHEGYTSLEVDSILVDAIENRNVFTCSTDDGSITFYSWKTQTPGTASYFDVVCKYKKQNGDIKSIFLRGSDREDEYLYPGEILDVFAIKKDDGTTFYAIPQRYGYSFCDAFMHVEFYMLDQDTLKRLTCTNGFMEDVYPDFDGCCTYNISYNEETAFSYVYDSVNKNLYCPSVVQSLHGRNDILSDRYEVFHFDGDKFIGLGESPNPRLHNSLHKYHRLAKCRRTNKYIVRIDVMDSLETKYRYSVWRSTEDMSQQPMITLYDGKYDEKNGFFVFYDKEYEYVVEPRRFYEDSIYHEFILIKKNGKVISKEEVVTN